ncbi:MAG TPA: amidohydrolase family protein, partial [Pyrinomonadaceae bacterium]|nr:amidohydrolase family protein [Pyrinomonadaceae bacterium]
KYRTPQTRAIDLKGRFVIPGFNDNHVHFASAAQFLEFNIMRVSTQDEFVARVKDVVLQLPKGEWILGGYWGGLRSVDRGQCRQSKTRTLHA